MVMVPWMMKGTYLVAEALVFRGRGSLDDERDGCLASVDDRDLHLPVDLLQILRLASPANDAGNIYAETLTPIIPMKKPTAW